MEAEKREATAKRVGRSGDKLWRVTTMNWVRGRGVHVRSDGDRAREKGYDVSLVSRASLNRVLLIGFN